MTLALNDVLDGLPHLVAVTRNDASLFFNATWRRYTGSETDWTWCIHPDDVAALLLEGGHDVRVRAADGGYGLFSSRMSTLDDGETRIYTFTPISEQQNRAQARADEFERIAETIPVIVFTSTPDGYDDYLNPVWYRYTGLTPEISAGWGWENVIHPDERSVSSEQWKASLASGEPFEMEYRLRRHDGEYRWHLGRAMPQRDRAGRIVRWFGTCTDIDDRKRADDRVRDREDYFRTMTDAIPQLVWTNDSAGQIDYVNSNWVSYTGMPQQALQGEATRNLLHPDDVAATLGAWEIAFRDGANFDATYRLRCADGGYRWFVGRATPIRDRDGRIVRWFGSATDIDDQKRAEELLERRVSERTNLLRRLADILMEFVDTGDFRQASRQLLEECLARTESEYGFIGAVIEGGPQGRILRVFADQGFHWDRNVNRELYEKVVQDYDTVGYIDFPRLDNLFGVVITENRAVLSNDPAQDARAGGRRPSGHPPLASFLGVPITRGSEVVGEVGVANRPGGYTGAELDTLDILSSTASVIYDSYRRQQREVTLDRQRREAEEHLRQSNQRLLDLAYVVSHELQEPLRIIDSDLRLLSVRYRDRLGADADEFIDKATRAARYVGRMVDDLWIYARIDRPNTVLAHVDVNELLPGVIESIRKHIEARDARVTHDTLPSVVAVRQQMEIVLEQLVLNGIQYNRSAPPRVHVTAAQDGGGWTFSVRDNGIGFDMVDANEVFKMFRRLQRDDSDQTGMGLAICRRIVEFHGGRIWATSTPGAGSTFSFTLPARDEATDLETLPARNG